MKKGLLILLAALMTTCGYAQTKADIFGNAPITWLGLDFSHLKFIGKASQHNNTGLITNADLQTDYFTSWNNLIFNEKDKFNVAAAVHRDFVGYAMDITQKENNKLTGTYITDNANEYQLLTADSISEFIARYDFGRKKGIGLLFFVEGMDRNKVETSVWVTFVDMSSKKVLLAERMTGVAGGAGFRNFWARSFSNVLWNTGKEFYEWRSVVNRNSLFINL